jgi:hypothetical protein
LLVGKGLAVAGPQVAPIGALETCAQAIAGGHVLHDPLELRPLPLAGVPGWHPDNEREVFYREAPWFCPARPGRRYPAAMAA